MNNNNGYSMDKHADGSGNLNAKKKKSSSSHPHRISTCTYDEKCPSYGLTLGPPSSNNNGKKNGSLDHIMHAPGQGQAQAQAQAQANNNNMNGNNNNSNNGRIDIDMNVVTNFVSVFPQLKKHVEV